VAKIAMPMPGISASKNNEEIWFFQEILKKKNELNGEKRYKIPSNLVAKGTKI
jgi:hypothetical protein